MAQQNVQETPQDEITTKKNLVIGTKKKRRLPFIVFLIVAVIATGGIIQAITRAKANAGILFYPESQFLPGQAQFFKTTDGRITIKYFILKRPDGQIRAAFDACEVCWPAGLGYHQEGDELICNKCGRHFPTKEIGNVQGGCNPVKLTIRIEDQKVMILRQDLLEGRKYFDFSKQSPVEEHS